MRCACWVSFPGSSTICTQGCRSSQQLDRRICSWIHSVGIATYLISSPGERSCLWSLDGYRSGIRTGLYGGLAVGGVHYLKDQMPIGLLRKLLVSWDLLDPSHESDEALETGMFSASLFSTCDVIQVQRLMKRPNTTMSRTCLGGKVHVLLFLHESLFERENYVPFRRIVKEELAVREAMMHGQRFVHQLRLRSLSFLDALRKGQMEPPQSRTAEIQRLLHAKGAHDPKKDEGPP